MGYRLLAIRDEPKRVPLESRLISWGKLLKRRCLSPNMWQQNYTPIGGNLLASALVAALPIFTILILLGILRRPAWLAAVSAVFVVFFVVFVCFLMLPGLSLECGLFGSAS